MVNDHNTTVFLTADHMNSQQKLHCAQVPCKLHLGKIPNPSMDMEICIWMISRVYPTGVEENWGHTSKERGRYWNAESVTGGLNLWEFSDNNTTEKDVFGNSEQELEQQTGEIRQYITITVHIIIDGDEIIEKNHKSSNWLRM